MRRSSSSKAHAALATQVMRTLREDILAEANAVSVGGQPEGCRRTVESAGVQ